MSTDWRDRPEATGGCQCGTVRYLIAAGPVRETVCGCRMCQRASGNFTSAFYEVDATRVTWTTAPPTTWASSDVADRGFCARCGTPLFFRETASGTIELLAATLATGTPFDPAFHVRPEGTPGWAMHLADMPVRPAEGSAPSRSNQAPED